MTVEDQARHRDDAEEDGGAKDFLQLEGGRRVEVVEIRCLAGLIDTSSL